MSEILQKSLASLPGLLTGSIVTADDSGSSIGLVNFIKNLSALTSKQNEQQLVDRELSHLQQKLASPSLTTAQSRDCLLRVVHCHMLGYDVSFAYIHAVKLAQQGTLLEKRFGYLACALFLSDGHELTMLLINTIHRDLKSTNIVQLCTALVAACHLVSSEMIPLLLSSVIDKLKHQKEIVRRKTVLCLQSFLCKAPELAAQVHGYVADVLGDKDPGVVWAVVEIYHQLVKIDASLCRDIVPAVVDILGQVISRRLPTLFDYHTVPSPWFTISLLKLLCFLVERNEGVAVSTHSVLSEILLHTEPTQTAGLAVIYETLMTVASIRSNPSLMSLAAKCVGRFMTSKKVNLVYIGIKVLSRIVSVDARYALQHQNHVMECLNHADQTIQSKTLELLSNMANSVNKDAICKCLVERLHQTDEVPMRREIIKRLTAVVHRLGDNTRWYIDNMSDLLKTSGSLAPRECMQQLITVIQHGLESSSELSNELDRHRYAVERYWRLLESAEEFDESLTCVAVWTLGEYASIMSSVMCDDVTRVLCRLNERSGEDKTRLWILSALTKLIPHADNLHQLLLSHFHSTSDSKNQELAQRLLELRTLTASSSSKRILDFSNRLTIDEMDFSLSFMDSYVSKALEGGAQPYRTPSLQRSVADAFEPEMEMNNADVTVSSFFASIEPRVSRSGSSASSHSNLAAMMTSNDDSSEPLFMSNQKLRSREVKEIWSREGIVSDVVNEENALPAFLRSTNMPSLNEGFEEVSIEEIRKQTLAAALFSGIEPIAPAGLPASPTNARKSVSGNNLDLRDEPFRQRSVSPDSIELIENVPSGRGLRYEMGDIGALESTGLSMSLKDCRISSGQHQSSQSVMYSLVNSRITLDTHYVEDKTGLQLVGGLPVNVTDPLRELNQDDSLTEVSDCNSDAFESTPKIVDNAEVFRSDAVSVTVRKRFACDHLSVELHFARDSDQEKPLFHDATATFDVKSIFNPSFDEFEEYLVSADNRRVVSLSSLSRQTSIGIIFPLRPDDAATLDDEEFCNSILVELTIGLNSNRIPIEICRFDFLRPLEMTVERFGIEWSSSRHEMKIEHVVRIQETPRVLDFLATQCHLHIVQTMGYESLLSTRVLNHTASVLVHCNVKLDEPSAKRRKLAIWAKSSSEPYLVALFRRMSTVLVKIS